MLIGISAVYELIGDLSEVGKWMINKDVRDIQVFTQTWGSTALGFNGIGGSAMTTAFTTVVTTVEKDQKSGENVEYGYVFFGGRKAYKKRLTEAFKEDLEKRWMVSVNEASKYD